MRTKKQIDIVKTLLMLAILILVNVVSVRFFGRIDLTKQGLYTLSPASKSILGKLDDRLTVRAYFTKDLPAPYNNNHRHLIDVLNEYRAFSDGKLQFEFISPEGEDGEQEAQKQGIPPVEIQVYQDDKLEVKRAYLGLVLMYEDKTETIPVIQRLSTLEYDISGAITRLTRKEMKRIGITQGNEELPVQEMQAAGQIIGRQHSVVTVNLSDSTGVPEDIQGLVIIDPKIKFSDTAKVNLDKYIMRGGRLAFLSGNVKIDPMLKDRNGRLINLNLDDIFENYGFRVNPDIIRDSQCASIAVVQQQGEFSFQSQVQFPYLPRISYFNESNMIVKDLQNVILQFTSSIDTNIASSKGISIETLMTTTEMAASETGRIEIDPFRKYSRDDFPLSFVPVGALLQGSFNSFYGGRDGEYSAKSPETRIIVVGTGLFMNDNFARHPDNMALFANIVDFLADDAGLISIRSKNVTMPPLDPLEDGTRRFLKYANMLAPPLLTAIFGLIRWRRRESLKRMFAQQLDKMQ